MPSWSLSKHTFRFRCSNSGFGSFVGICCVALHIMANSMNMIARIIISFCYFILWACCPPLLFALHCICSDTALLNDHYRADGVGRYSSLSFIRWAKYSCAPLLVVPIKLSFSSWALVRVVLCKWIAREQLCIRDHRVLRYKNSF